MKYKVSLLNQYSLVHRIDKSAAELPELRHDIADICGTRIRRVDRYIELCLLGALRCGQDFSLPDHAAVYLATRCGAVETSRAAMINIYHDRQPPKPLHFVNTLGNTACFYLTKTLGIHGQALVLSQEHLSFEAALFQAWLDIASGAVETALVGGIDEVVLPLEEQALRLGEPEAKALLEGSHWMLLTRADTSSEVILTQPNYLQGLGQLEQWLGENMPQQVCTSFTLSANERALLERSGAALSDQSAAARFNALEHGVYSGHSLVTFFESTRDKMSQNANDATAVHLTGSDELYCAITTARGQPNP